MATRSSTRLLLWLAALGVLLALLVIGGVTLLMWDGGPESLTSGNKKGWLKLELRGEIADSPRIDALSFDPEDRALTVGELAAAVGRAQTDPDITGIFVDLDNPQLTMATAQELRGALPALATSGVRGGRASGRGDRRG